MKKVLLLKNVMEDEDVGIYSTLDKAKEKLINILNKKMTFSHKYYELYPNIEKDLINEIKEDIDRIEKSHTIEDFNDEMIDNYEITEWEIDE